MKVESQQTEPEKRKISKKNVTGYWRVPYTNNQSNNGVGKFRLVEEKLETADKAGFDDLSRSAQ